MCCTPSKLVMPVRSRSPAPHAPAQVRMYVPSSRQPCDAIVIKTLASCHDVQPFHLRLSNEDPVEWIVVMAGKLPCRYAMSDAYRQRQEPARLYLLLKIIRCGELPQRLLDGNLPRTRSRHGNEIGRIRDRL